MSTIQELRKRWDKTLGSILARTYRDLSLEVPNLPETELVKQAPDLLERATRSNVQKKKGKYGFVIISAPSGGGKGTIGKSIEGYGFQRFPRVTTRNRRPGEEEGKSYFFVSKEVFLQRDGENEFLPWTETHGEYRATSRKMLLELLGAKAKFYIEGSAGVYQEVMADPDIKNANPLSVFLISPSFDVLEQRLRGRPDKIDEDEIIERLGSAVKHLEKTASFHYDAYYVNNTIDRCGQAIAEDF